MRTVSRLVCAHVGYIQPRVVIFRGESERGRENAESFDRPKQIHGLKYFDVESSRSMDVNALEQAELLLAASRYSIEDIAFTSPHARIGIFVYI